MFIYTGSDPQNVGDPQNVDFWKNWFLTPAMKQYMAKWQLTPRIDIHYEIQAGRANLNKFCRFVSHHYNYMSNVARGGGSHRYRTP